MEHDVQVKLFESYAFSKAELETQINQWLDEHSQVSIVEIKQSAASGFIVDSLFVTIWYREDTR